jgi:hypothetical protein
MPFDGSTMRSRNTDQFYREEFDLVPCCSSDYKI